MSDVVFQPTDVVLAKVKGFSAWPAMIIPGELIPENILKNKPMGAYKGKSADGKEAEAENQEQSDGEDEEAAEEEEEEEDVFADSDANPENFIIYTPVLKFRKYDTLKPVYCVKFFCDDSYIWVKPTDMKILTGEECRQWLNGKQRKNKKLIPAYEMAMKGKDGIDIWEFVEYGSYGKPDEEEYVEEDEEQKKTAKRPTRSSSRQRQKRVFETDKSEEGEPVKRKRVTRSTRQQRVDEEEEEEEEGQEEQEPEGEEEEFVRKRPQRGKPRKAVATKTKLKPKSKPKKEKPSPPKVIKYHFEDDEDWSIVGLGPQDLSIEKTMDPIAKKLSQKKNLERHVEIKLDLEDKLAGINKLLCDVLCSGVNRTVSIKDDFEIILDELQIALNTRGSKNEFITIFQSNNSLLLYFRILFNLRRKELNKWGLWGRFQDIFEHIYSYEFRPDTTDWQLEQDMELKEEQQQDADAVRAVKEEKSEVEA